MKQFNELAQQNFSRIEGIKVDTADVKNVQLIENRLQLSTVDDAFHMMREPTLRLNTGILGLDELFGEYKNGEYKTGFQLKDIIILSGMSGIGKTTVAFSIFNTFYKNCIPTAFFSFDMRKEKTWDSFRKAFVGSHATDLEFADTLLLSLNNCKLPRIISQQGIIATSQIDNFLSENPCQVIFIDYIDKLKPINATRNAKWDFSALFNELKAIAQKHNCAIILLSQGTEDKSYRQGRPTLSNLYGGKEVRSEVDHVIAVYRNSKHNENLPAQYKTVTELHGLKLRSDSSNSVAYVRYCNGNMVHMAEDEVLAYKQAQNKL